ncbi:MAG: type II toxin-antitoxin system HicB family antitoxin, partial [Vulcanimicrobiaceae bacterium]
MKYAVVFEQARDGGWNAYVPDLPGCVSNGATIDDARKHVRQ